MKQTLAVVIISLTKHQEGSSELSSIPFQDIHLKRPISYRSFADDSLIMFDEFTSHTYQLAAYAEPLLKLLVKKHDATQQCNINEIANLAESKNIDVESYYSVIKSLIELNILAEEEHNKKQ